MTRALRTARACQAATAGLTASALYGASIHPVLALPGLVSAAVFAVCSVSYLGQHREIIAKHEAARRAAAETPVDMPPPCCTIWFESVGTFHGEDCTRPIGYRTDDYRLDAGSRAVFEEIAARHDHGTAA
jgi:hypothetical protein